MTLPKKDLLALIHRRIDTLSASIAALDSANAKKSSIEADLVKLRAVETDLIANDDCKPDALALHRAKTDLATGKLQRAQKAVFVAEERVVLDAETASVLIYQFKQAAVTAYFDRAQRQFAEFFDRNDLGMLKSLASRGERAKTLLNHPESNFNPRTPSLRAHDLSEARALAGAFKQLEEASADLDFVTDIPHSCL